jgi:Family of unknown function (DUF6588)
MKKNKCRLGIIILALSIGTTSQMRAQLYELEFVYGGVADAEKILQAYLEPFANILGSDLNAGWYNTARPHKLGGLDITATASWAKAPPSLFTYDVSALNLSGTIVPGSPTNAPTIAGSMDERPTLAYSETVSYPDGSTQDIEYASFTLPNGSGVDFFPLPMLQLTVGLPLGTDVSVRFVPMVQLGEYGEIGLWGVGGKHSISQWIPGIKELKLLDISLQGGYTIVSSSANVDVEPLDVDVDNYPGFDWDDQFMNQDVSGWTLNLIASQTLSVLTIYEGIGYANSLVEMALQGHYPIHTVILEEGDNLGKTTYEIVEDPFTLKYENMSNLRLNIGARIKLAVLTLHYDFTYTLYATHSVGVGISFR